MKFQKFKIIIPPESIECYLQCLKKIAAGDSNAFEWLYKNYCGKLYDYAYLLSNDPYLSEDVVQDVFIRIWNNRQALLNVKNVNAYLHTSIKNHLLNIQKAKKTELAHLAEWKQRLSNHSDVCPLAEKETKVLMANAIASLTERQRLFYRLTREQEKSHAEISEEHRVSLNTVKNIIIRATRKIKGYMVMNQ